MAACSGVTYEMEITGKPFARLATTQDVEEIVRICSQGWRDTYRDPATAQYIEQTIAEFYTSERIASEIGERDERWGGYVVAELAGRLLVAGGGGMIEPNAGELFVLYADPRQRRRGGGTAVLEFITRQQRERGAVEQWVSVEPDNELGLAFYRARGFVERGRRPAHRGDGESVRLSRPI
jgi:ribosomal protein S18 acetylase RimI-like enzyme